MIDHDTPQLHWCMILDRPQQASLQRMFSAWLGHNMEACQESYVKQRNTHTKTKFTGNVMEEVHCSDSVSVFIVDV
eukprot:1160730-Pelagomonas_calceolata.AAC.10